MNTEDQLHRASDEMDRVTASLTPPPAAVLRKAARRRATAVAVATAVGVVLIVGGVVLALRQSGQTTLSPAGPTEMTAAPIVVDGIPVVIPDLDPFPEFDLGTEAREVDAAPLAEDYADDVRAGIELLGGSSLDRIDRVVFLGGSGSSRGYAFIGVYGASASADDDGKHGTCVVTFSFAQSRATCPDPGEDIIERSVDVRGDRATFAVAGRAPAESSVLVIDVGGERTWRRTRDGYAFLAVEGPTESFAQYIVYDVAGNVLEGTFFDGSEGATDVASTETVAPAVEDDGACSASGHYPDQVLTAELPEPVIQTLGKILLFADRCWFEELADVAADNFTSSFGGMDHVALWTFEEEQGYEPMAALLQILDMPYGTSEVEGRVLYIWPAAAAHDGDWESMPQEDKDALRGLYDDEDFAGFASFGAYIGYRLGISEDGDWSFFVAGD